MNDEELFRSYLSTRAGTIELPEGDPAGIQQRAERRHRRRRNGALGVTALIAATGLTVALTAGRDDSSLQTAAGPGSVASPLHWQEVDTSTGLAWTQNPIVAGSGGLYALSTAPGPLSPDGLAGDGRQHLYRSSNGSDWSEVDLPANVWASSLTANGDTLYAVGTAPAGGGARKVVVASSDDGGGTWSSADLPTDLADLTARYPGEVVVNGFSVATGPGGVVVTFAVQSVPDIGALIARAAPTHDVEGFWNITSTGVDVLGLPDGADCGDRRLEVPTSIADDDAASAEAEGVVGKEGCAFDRATAPVTASYTWAQLGADPELVALMDGRPLVYAAGDGGEFEPVDLPAGTVGTTPRVVGTGDGYVLALGHTQRNEPYGSDTTVLRSADGAAWADDPSGATSGYPADAGLLAGRPAFAVYGESGALSVRALGADGAWQAIDLASSLPPAPSGTEYGMHSVAFGPLGVAVAVNSFDAEEGMPLDSYLLHSLDGTDVSAVPLDDYLESGEQVVGIAISADAVVVRVNGPTDGDPETPVPQRAIVGTLN